MYSCTYVENRCREEIALWKEKQVQVAKEEMRIKESLAQMKEKDSQLTSTKAKELQAKVLFITMFINRKVYHIIKMMNTVEWFQIEPA